VLYLSYSSCGSLISKVGEFLKEIEGILSSECLKELALDDIKGELSRLAPYLKVIFSRWVPEIIYALYLKRRLSFNEMKKAFGISSRVLTDKLRLLEEYGLVKKEVDTSTRPIRVYYELTNSGKEVGLALIPLLTILKGKVKSI